MDGLIYLVVIVAITIILFLIFRAVVLWYFKLDEMAQSLALIAQNSAATVNNTMAISEQLDEIEKIVTEISQKQGGQTKQ